MESSCLPGMDWAALVQFPDGRFARGSAAGHGVAIAPAKQRRVRTIVIRVSAMVGAGAAVGAVAALTRAPPSKPPGPR